MCSGSKRRANCLNSQSSTGPKTAEGKARASQNARRHGLSLPVIADPVLCVEVEELARRAAGENAAPEIFQLAVKFAVAQVDISRIRRVRRDFLAVDLTSRTYEPKRTMLEESQRARWAIYFQTMFDQELPFPPDTLGTRVD